MNKTTTTLGVIIAGGILWYLASPLFFDQVIEEQLPPVAIEENAQEPTRIAEGEFTGADSFHKGSGIARILSMEDDALLLRLEEFSVTNGPDLSVYLSRESDGSIGEEFLDLGKLKGNRGNQNYMIPDGTDLADYQSVVIHCVLFNVPFASAVLE